MPVCAPARAPAGDRSVRNLVHLRSGASSSRTLNLLAVWEREADSDALRAAPFFHHPALSRCLIVKHRLRQHEHEHFASPRTLATKVILPINPEDLRAGGWAFFIGERGYAQLLDDLDSGPVQDRDRRLLQILDALPSLDPFLTREHLRRMGFTPARCCFEVSEADVARMFEFTRREVSPLISLTLGDLEVGAGDKVSTLASKILNNAGDAELEPLRRGMGLDRYAFDEGVFCWKGFIYYKWALQELAPTVRPVSEEISRVRPSGESSLDEKQAILAIRARLAKAIAASCDVIRDTLQVYDDAYGELIHAGRPNAFRDFLLDAPRLFHELGERVGALQHIVSFWRYRFPNGPRAHIRGAELLELLADFEQSLSVSPSDPRETS